MKKEKEFIVSFPRETLTMHPVIPPSRTTKKEKKSLKLTEGDSKNFEREQEERLGEELEKISGVQPRQRNDRRGRQKRDYFGSRTHQELKKEGKKGSE